MGNRPPNRRRPPAAIALLLLLPPLAPGAADAQPQRLAGARPASLSNTLEAATTAARQPRLGAGYWTRGLLGGWGRAWKYGVPGYGKTESDVRFAAFHPQLGRFVTDHLELYGEGALLLYRQPAAAVGGGLAGLGGRYHLWRDRGWTPYAVGIAGLLWTSLEAPEIDRIFNFQLVYGLGVRMTPPRGPGLIVELRNHHTSNAGTAGENLGLNAAVVVAGVHWVLR